MPAFAQGSGNDGYEANTVVDFGGAVARIVKINIESNQLGLAQAYGLSEVRFFFIPTYAREPQPKNASMTDGINVQLNWRPGREAALHEVHFGMDVNNLMPVDTVTDSTY